MEETPRSIQERLVLLRRLEREHNDQRRTLLAEWEDIKAVEFRTFDQAARTVSDKLRNSVQVEVTGSIDSRMVRELVEEILEGGREAFETRRWKYGF